MVEKVYQRNLDAISQYFKDGIKGPNYHTLGLEVEHIIVYTDTNEAVPYSGEVGIESILHELCVYYPDSKIDTNGPLLGFNTDKFSITLEPAAQFEISIFPLEDISAIDKIYSSFRSNLDEILAPLQYSCITLGYQPKSCVNDLSLIPKKRYDFMDRYFQTSGTCGRNMMRGTASVQVSIDYSSESDFRNKIQTAYTLSPYLKILTDNSPYFEGAENSRNLLRSYIWENVDPSRVGLIPGVMEKDFGFMDYAKYILDLEPIFMPASITGSQDIYLDRETLSDYIGDRDITHDEIIHAISMPFPDIRLKQYLEIRVADSMEKSLTLAYCALIKGLFYNESFLGKSSDFIQENKIDKDAIAKAHESLYKDGKKGTIYGIPLKKIHEFIIENAQIFLSDSEKQYLNPLLNRI